MNTEYNIGDTVKIKLTGEKAMVVDIIKSTSRNQEYILRLTNYGELNFREFELEPWRE